MTTTKPAILFQWNDSHRQHPDDRAIAARIIRAHRNGRTSGAWVAYDRRDHRIEVGNAGSTVTGIWTRA